MEMNHPFSMNGKTIRNYDEAVMRKGRTNYHGRRVQRPSFVSSG